MIRRKKNGYWKRYFSAFSLLVVLAIISSLVFQTIKLVKDSFIDGIHRVSIVLVTEKDVALATIEPQTVQGAILIAPTNLILSIPFREGEEYQVGKIFDLGELDRQGGPLLVSSVEFFMKVPVDGYVVAKNSRLGGQSAQELISVGSLFPILFEMQSGRIKTNLTPFDIVRLIISFQNLKENEKQIIAIEKSRQAYKEELVDGTQVVRIKESYVDNLFEDLFTDKSVLDEKLGVSLVNGGELQGAGAVVATLVANMGVNVVSVTTASSIVDASIVVTTKEGRGSYTAQKIAQLLGLPIEEQDLIKEDIRIILGEDFSQNVLQWK